MSTAADLRLIATTWPDLNEALGMPTQIGGFGRGLRSYMNLLDETDVDAAAELRALERDPAQIGQRPIPIRLAVYATMRTVEAALTECAEQTAAAVQRSPMPRAPRTWPATDRARRDQLAIADASDPRRWRYTGRRPSAPYTALWLLARVTGAPGPFRPLQPAQHQHIARVAAEARHRIEQALDTGAEEVELSVPCPRMIHVVFPCGGTIRVYGGAGASPLANCDRCGGVWTEQGVAA